MTRWRTIHIPGLTDVNHHYPLTLHGGWLTVSTTPGRVALAEASPYLGIYPADLIAYRPDGERAHALRVLGDGHTLVIAEAIVYEHRSPMPERTSSRVEVYRAAPCRDCGCDHHPALYTAARGTGCALGCLCPRWRHDLLLPA